MRFRTNREMRLREVNRLKENLLMLVFFFQLKESVKASYDPAIVSYKYHSKNKLSQSLESNDEYDHRESDLK